MFYQVLGESTRHVRARDDLFSRPSEVVNWGSPRTQGRYTGEQEDIESGERISRCRALEGISDLAITQEDVIITLSRNGSIGYVAKSSHAIRWIQDEEADNYKFIKVIGSGLALTECGKVATINNSHIVILPIKHKIKDIASGSNHFYAITDDNRILAWGENQTGQCGLGDRRNKPSPEEIKLFRGEVVFIAPGSNHTLALKNNQVYSWGMDSHGQLGQGYTDGLAVPMLIKRIKDVDVIEIAAGKSHSLALSSSGVVYAWGDTGMGHVSNSSGFVVDGLSLYKIVHIFSGYLSGHTFCSKRSW
ncbi:E3 ubiquitin-protein ligase HERC [Acrasis kona]|uniref:E3 ubiquitin-protein ligase HERC n=1 Tax=Acrasis kona TaxID=1008807 RepID=A0AAW2YZS5_9EUKA